MKKGIAVLAAAGCMALAMSVTAFAGQWKEDSKGWWYDNEDGTYPASCGKWIDGNGDGIAEYYYFNEKGYMLSGGMTPDGKTVTVDGKWIKEGTIQTRDAASIQNQNTLLTSVEPHGTKYFIRTPEASTDSKGITYIKPLVISCTEDKGNCYCEYDCGGYVRLRADKIALGNGSTGSLAEEVIISVYDASSNKLLGSVTVTPDTEDGDLDVDIVGRSRIKLSARITKGTGSSADVIFDNLRFVK